MRILLVSVIILIVDQVTKLIVKGISIPALNIHFEGMAYAERINVIGSFLRITFVENPGMAFGIDLGLSSKLFLSLFSIAASIGILYYLFKVRKEGLIVRLPLALILGGAIGNLIDRIFYGVIYDYAPLFYGKVVDFVDVDFFDINLFGYSYDRWPIFNVADMSVSIGVILLLLFNKKYSKSAEEENNINVSVQSETGTLAVSGVDFNNSSVSSEHESTEYENKEPGTAANTITEESNNQKIKEYGKPDNGENIQV